MFHLVLYWNEVVILVGEVPILIHEVAHPNQYWPMWAEHCIRYSACIDDRTNLQWSIRCYWRLWWWHYHSRVM